MEKYYQPETIEPMMQALWEAEGVYRFDPGARGPVYAIDTPPPTISGSLHIGHLFSYVQAEMIARYRRLRGDNVFYPFGFDDNGLPTERLVEREQGVRARDLPAGAFEALCLDTAQRYEQQFVALWKSLGFSVDWSLQYRTISPEVQALSQKSFLELVRKGLAYHKESPVLWCTECRTSIAQAELDSGERESAFHHIPFFVDGEPLLVATTRPELLYGCVSLFVHPEDERYRRFLGKEAEVPLYGHRIPVLADEKADPDKGTGVVMCATYGDATDVEWRESHGLPYRRVLLPDGKVDESVPYLGGMRVKKARDRIVALLAEAGLLHRSDPIVHAVAIHERCGTAVEILPSRQWYIDILSRKEEFLAAGDEINWYPAHMHKRYQSWVENLKWDWCISRQRYFGVPFPVWYCRDCGKPHFPAADQLPVRPGETAYEGRCDCGCGEFLPETAVMDTWATSSLTPQITTGYEAPLFPMGMRTQAHEIIRTWTFYTIVKSLYHTGKVPWKDIMVCGFVLAKQGEKISKSKNNATSSPEALVAAHSADVLRYWAASSRLGTDTFFAQEDLAVSKRFANKLWNAAKFALSHLEDFSPALPPQRLLPIDRWLLERLDQCTARVCGLLDRYEIGSARLEIDGLFWQDFCDDYLEIAKERLYQPEKHGADRRRSGQWALYHGLLGILRLYGPYVPHLTEYLYQQSFRRWEGAVSLHLTRLEPKGEQDGSLLAFGELVKGAVADMRRYKSEHGLSMKAEMEALVIATDGTHDGWLRESEMDLLACSGAKRLVLEAR